MEFLIYRSSYYEPLSEYKLAKAGFKFKELKDKWDEDVSMGVIEIDNFDELMRLNGHVGSDLVVGDNFSFSAEYPDLKKYIQIYDGYLE